MKTTEEMLAEALRDIRKVAEGRTGNFALRVGTVARAALAAYDQARAGQQQTGQGPKCELVQDGATVRARSVENPDWWLRYSRGPRQGHLWDAYGDDYQSEELARLAIAAAPPLPSGKPYVKCTCDLKTFGTHAPDCRPQRKPPPDAGSVGQARCVYCGRLGCLGRTGDDYCPGTPAKPDPQPAPEEEDGPDEDLVPFCDPSGFPSGNGLHWRDEPSGQPAPMLVNPKAHMQGCTALTGPYACDCGEEPYLRTQPAPKPLVLSKTVRKTLALQGQPAPLPIDEAIVAAQRTQRSLLGIPEPAPKCRTCGDTHEVPEVWGILKPCPDCSPPSTGGGT